MPVHRTTITPSPAQSGSPASRLRSPEPPFDNHSIREGIIGEIKAEGAEVGEAKVITALVGRIVNKLPCNSGTRLGMMEMDATVQMTLQTLFQFSQIRLAIVVQALVAALENLSKFSNIISVHDTPLDTLHSQVFLLHLLLSCLTSSWRKHSQRFPPAPAQMPRLWPDPLPFDEQLARHVMLVALEYTRLASADLPSGSGTASPALGKDGKGISGLSKTSRTQSSVAGSSDHLGSGFLQQHSYPRSGSIFAPQRVRKVSSYCTTVASTISQMSRYTSGIVFSLSASNWPVVYGRLKARISYLTTTIDEHADVIELRLLEWANLDRARLGQVLQEVSNTFLHVKRPAQVALAVMLRHAIWTWISAYPAEYQALVESNGKMEGNPDVLFDVLSSMFDLNSSTNARRARVFGPLMAMLLVLCPDILKRVVTGDTGPRGSFTLGKKSSFLESIRKGLASNKGFETRLVCHVDLIRAAVALPPGLAGSGLRSLVPDSQNNVKAALFHTPLANELTDCHLLVNGLIAIYRTDPTDLALFQRLWSDPPELHKAIAVKALADIFIDRDLLYWYPPIADLRGRNAAAICTLLKSQAELFLGNKSGSRRPRPSGEATTASVDLLLIVLDLYAMDPATASAASSNQFDGMREVLFTLSSLLVVPSPEIIRSAAVRTAVTLFGSLKDILAANEALALPRDQLGNSIWQCLHAVSQQGLYAHHSGIPDDMLQAAEAFQLITVAIMRLGDVAPDLLADLPLAPPATVLAAVNALTTITSPDVDQISLLSPALSALAKLVVLANRTVFERSSVDDPVQRVFQEALATHVGMLEKLACLPPAAGGQQRQRQVRRLLRDYPDPTIVGTTVWLGNTSEDERSKRNGLVGDVQGLSEVSKLIPQNPFIDGPKRQGDSKTWQNLMLVLCCTASWCMYENEPHPTLSSTIGKGALPRVYDDDIDSRANVEIFIKSCVGHLISGSVFIRETAKEALGSELPPSLSPVLIKQMSKLMSHSVGPNGLTISEPFITFVDQAISVLRLLIERMQSSESATAPQIDIGNFLHTIGRFVHRLVRDELGLRIKAKFCQLCESVSVQSDFVTLSNDVQFRNSALNWLVEWSVTSGKDPDAYSVSVEPLSKLQRDLDHACLRAMVSLSEGLVLRGTSGDEADDTQTVVQSRLFYRHYQYLVGILERARRSDGESFQTPSTNAPHSSRNFSPDDVPVMAIITLSNLLRANIDVGLKICMEMGYHEDANLRVGFMQLLTNILKLGARFGGLGAKRMSTSPKVYLENLTAPNLALAVAMCEACPAQEAENLSNMLFRSFEAKGSLLSLLRVLIEREVVHEAELFRANSVTTRLLTVFAKTYGYNYLRGTLQPLLRTLVDKPTECSFELDPAKAGPTDDIERNADDLKLTCQALLDLICASTPRVPIMFRAVCHYIWEIVEDRFPDSRHSAVGSFIFLRFFCPALVSPESVDLDFMSESREIRRALLLITKVMQNLANNVVFREPHMKSLNLFLSENIRPVTKFLSDLAVRPRSFEVTAVTKAAQEEGERSQDIDADNTFLHRFAFKHSAKLESSLEALPVSYRPTATNKSARFDMDGRSALFEFQKTMRETGPPVEVQKMSASARSQAHEEFMKHNHGRNTDAVAGAFYEGPASQNGRRLFYFIVARTTLVDYDLLAYHMFLILEKITDFFDLIIDLTDYSPANDPPLAWLKRSLQLCPPGILPGISTLAIYNPNPYARKRIKRIVAELQPIVGIVGKRCVAASAPAELAESIPFTSLALPDSTMTLAYQAERTWMDVLRLSDHEQQVPCSVKMGYNCLQVGSSKPLNLTTSIKTYIVDIIRLEDITDVTTGGSSDHLIVKYSQNQSVTIISDDKIEMLAMIRAARSQLRDKPSEDRALQPGDVPGTLLNVALVNLSSSDETLRLGSYSLIQELAQFFKFDVPSRLLGATGLTIPTNSLGLAINLSQAFAVTAPHLTLDFMKEWVIGFTKADLPQKTACLQYLTPWLANLEVYAKFTAEHGNGRVHQVLDIVKSLISVTLTERKRLCSSLHEHIWAILARSHEAFLELITCELLHYAIDAGMGSEKTECACDILITMSNTAVRGKIAARLRKALAQTYLKPSLTLTDNAAWSEICTLTRVSLCLAFRPASAVDTQLFLPDMVHCVTLLVGTGPLVVRQTVYGLLVNALQSLATWPPTGDMDGPILQDLLRQAQTPTFMAAFGLRPSTGGLELVESLRDASDLTFLAHIDEVATFCGEMLYAAAPSIDCSNAWRARWMGLVASTCFQQNAATQPQTFITLGYLTCDEADDDIIYQILVALATTLSRFRECDHILVISMLRCLSKVVSGLPAGSRHPCTIFWLGISILQLGHIPLFAVGLQLVLDTLKTIGGHVRPGQTVMDALMGARGELEEPAGKLDQVSGVSFDTDPQFSLIAIVYKGVRHPSTRALTIELLTELLKLSGMAPDSQEDGSQTIGSRSIAPFVALLSVVISSPADLKALFVTARVKVSDDALENVSTLSVFGLLSVPDNSTAVLLVTLVSTIITSASSDAERLVLYRLLASASVEMPDIVAMTYDTLIPRMTAALATSSNNAILSVVSLILEKAMVDSSYTFHSAPNPSDSTTNLHRKSYSASIISVPSTQGVSTRDQVLEDLGMRGLCELTFPSVRMDRVAPMAKWVAALIHTFT